MAGEYGIAQGINQGLQAVNQGMMTSENIQAQREARRLAAERHSMSMQQAQVTMNTSNLQLVALQKKLEEFEKNKAREDSFNAFSAYEETGDIKYLNLAKEKNPILKSMFETNGTVSMQSIKDFSQEKLVELGYDSNKYHRPVVVNKADGTQKIEDLTGTYVASGYLREMRKDKLEDLVLSIKEKQVRAEEANLGVTEAKSNLSTQLLSDLQARVSSGELSPEEAWAQLNSKGKSEQKPFSIQSAEYFGNIKTKIINGTATEAEKSTYNSWLTEQGGSGVATNEKISTDINNITNSGIDLTAENFSLDKVPSDYKTRVNTAIRDLENTPGGKKLVNNISKKLGDGLGAVQSTAGKLSDLATKENVSTAIVKNQIDAVKQYIPEELQDIDEADLKDIEFRQAFLSVTATMLKLQSGLTVSEAEAQRFAGSMGTLNKNTKVNMSGLKNKLDELIGDYEANKYLEPTLYNAKYRAPIQGLKSISSQLDEYLGDTAPKVQYKAGQIARNPKTGETLIFDGKEWKPQ